MNSYSEDLHEDVLHSLQNQELYQKQLEAQLNASMFTLYYADGAEINATKELKITTESHKNTQFIKKQAVDLSNLSSNLLMTAKQQNVNTSQSVTNNATCAANIQIAANAIDVLAEDIGAIYAILQASDFGTQIYQLSKLANDLISSSANLAETVSLQGMEASISIAEVTASTVQENAKNTDDSISNLLKVISIDYETIAEKMVTDNNSKAIASSNARKAEGIIENSKIGYEASKRAFELESKELNLNLRTELTNSSDILRKSYSVLFDYYQSPFTLEEIGDYTTANPASDYSVESYNILVVKEKNKTIFSSTDAEIVLGNLSQHISVPSLYSQKNQDITVIAEMAKKGVNISIKLNELLDSDNEAIQLGEKYVILILTIFTSEHKKRINSFENYLSAPSKSFTITNVLPAIPVEEIIVTKAIIDSSNTKKPVSFPKSIEFLVKNIENVEYRCMFLPYPNSNLLLTEGELDNLESEIERLEAVERNYLVSKESNSLKESSVSIIKNTKAFFFNSLIAGTISANNYSVANPIEIEGKDTFSDLLKYEVLLHKDTTDNFGSPLLNHARYIPVILSYYSGLESKKSQFTNQLSDWENTPTFTFLENSNLHSSNN